ncbi:antibiotic biosynthesis monooxygenase [Ktedonobacter sp. SOSP1-85]|uniref:antibiotic biosynthesis monooxygenase family protein n=1 Tax=Ktedonobacter sp. SOSP1-85 TaxID=2778367 RepID=UPI0019155580|nr:antibiotic biosynthesis monooxygenase family protein [Ktedonobacter sp. SOSP1-85]GHO77443.1 antibiotic biosynthesis monooxygenase [Ktedonobacter sp. SOSP1-85]
MTTIRTEQQLVTLINVFTVEPKRQQELVDFLAHITATIINKQPGYISANIHKSLDGTKVTNYAQWRSQAEFEAMLRNPKAREHMQQAMHIATRAEPTLYKVAYIDHVEEHTPHASGI